MYARVRIAHWKLKNAAICTRKSTRFPPERASRRSVAKRSGGERKRAEARSGGLDECSVGEQRYGIGVCALSLPCLVCFTSSRVCVCSLSSQARVCSPSSGECACASFLSLSALPLYMCAYVYGGICTNCACAPLFPVQANVSSSLCVSPLFSPLYLMRNCAETWLQQVCSDKA